MVDRIYLNGVGTLRVSDPDLRLTVNPDLFDTYQLASYPGRTLDQALVGTYSISGVPEDVYAHFKGTGAPPIDPNLGIAQVGLFGVWPYGTRFLGGNQTVNTRSGQSMAAVAAHMSGLIPNPADDRLPWGSPAEFGAQVPWSSVFNSDGSAKASSGALLESAGALAAVWLLSGAAGAGAATATGGAGTAAGGKAGMSIWDEIKKFGSVAVQSGQLDNMLNQAGISRGDALGFLSAVGGAMAGAGAAGSPHGAPVKTWPIAGGQTGALYQDGWLSATKKNGTIKYYKPKRPVVVTSKSDLRTVLRAQKMTTNMLKDAAHAYNRIHPPRGSAAAARRKGK